MRCRLCKRNSDNQPLCYECSKTMKINHDADGRISLVPIYFDDDAHKKAYIHVDVQKGFFEKSDLNYFEIEYLRESGYSISYHRNLKSNRQVAYLLKPRYNESLDHFFLVKAIERYISNFTKEIYLYQTLKPDIIFFIKKKKIAIEVETGKINNTKILENKVKINNKEYGKNWFFVVTSKYYKNKYQKYKKRTGKYTVLFLLCFPIIFVIISL